MIKLTAGSVGILAQMTAVNYLHGDVLLCLQVDPQVDVGTPAASITTIQHVQDLVVLFQLAGSQEGRTQRL